MRIRRLRQEDKFQAPLTSETIPVSDYSTIPLSLSWARGLTGSEELAQNFEANGFTVFRHRHTIVAWAPLGWFQFVDPEGSVRLFDEHGILRAIRKRINDRLPEMTFFTLEYGYNIRTNKWYLYDRLTGKRLKTCKSRSQMEQWILLHCPQRAGSAAYRDMMLSAAA